jgi:hypothetical protein
MAKRQNQGVSVCVSVSQFPAGMMEKWSCPTTRRVGVAAAPSCSSRCMEEV